MYELKDPTIQLENMRIVFRNFAGKADKYNDEGNRNFAVLLDDDIAQALMDDGWNVKRLRVREEGDIPQAYLQVKVSYKIKPPRVVLITSKGRTILGEDELEILDWIDIDFVDLRIQPSNWAVNGNTGVKAYLKSIFIVMREDPLELKWAHVPLEIEALPARAGRVDEGEYIEGEIIEGRLAIER